METRETIERHLIDNITVGRVSEFAKLFFFFIFVDGSTMPRSELLKHTKYIFEIAVRGHKDELALDTLKKIHEVYHIIEEEVEEEKERCHMSDASRRASNRFCEFIISIYPTIAWKKKIGLDDEFETVMQKTRFQILEYASKKWTQEMTDESYTAFRFLVKAFETQEKKEILDKIFRPRVERWFTKVESIEQWLMLCEKDPMPFEIQQLFAMARAKVGGPELAKQDIANAKALELKKT